MNRRVASALKAGLFLLPVLVLLPNLGDFPYLPGAAFSDMAISHYPNLLFLQRSLQNGIIPLWSPSILSGFPFAANPLSGLWYPPGWLALLFSLPMGINIALVLHILWGGAGMYRLLRSEGLAEGPALFGALAFEAMPKVFSHLAAGHVTLIFAVAWTPWLLYAERRWGGASGEEHRAKRLLPGIALGMIALADPRWAAYAGLLWVAYSLRQISAISRSQNEQAVPPKKAVARGLVSTAANGITAFLVAAPLLVPLIEYTRLAGRSAMTVNDSLALSLPPGQLFGLAYPYIAGMAEWVLYPGGAVLILALFALVSPEVRRPARFWLWLALISLVIASGANVPLARLAWQAPGLNLLRVPARALFLTGMAMTAAAAFAVQQITLDLPAEGSLQTAFIGKRAGGLILFTCAAFLGLFGAAAWLAVPDPLSRLRFGWGSVFIMGSAALALLASARKIPPWAAFTALVTMCLVDVLGVNGLSLDFRPARAPDGKAPQTTAEQAADFLQERGAAGGDGAFRVYSPSYSIPQDVAAEYGLELADGVDPLRLAAYDRFMERASGVPFTGYSVTLPPFASGDPKNDNRASVPDGALLGLINVKYVAAEFPLQVEELSLLAQFGDTHIFQNELALPRAWVQSLDAPAGSKAQPVELLVHTPNAISLSARGPGRLVLAEMAYPGWAASVDGKPVAVETVMGLLRAVALDEGDHVVTFRFQPVSVYAGAAAAGIFWAAWAALALSGSARGQRNRG